MNPNLRKTLVLFFLQLWAIQIIAQVITLSGTIRNESTHEPVPFANLWITGYTYGTSTNFDGNFEIKVNKEHFTQDHSLSFSCIGYESKELPFTQISLNDKLIVNLSPSTTSLSEVVIYSERFKKKLSNQAKRLVAKALNRIPKNYPKKPHLLNTFYRHYCSENDDYVRLIEAALDIYQPKSKLGFHLLPDDKLAFKLTQLRRSFDFTQNAKIYHPPISLNFLISNDITSYLYHNPIATHLDPYEFMIEDTTNYADEKVIVVQFQEKNKTFQSNIPKYKGRLYIIQSNLAFIRIEIDELRQKNNPLDSVNSIVSKLIAFKGYEDKFYLDRISSDVLVHYVTKDSSGSISNNLKHTSHIELITNNIVTQNPPSFEGKEPTKIQLQQINYDSVFWQNYTVLKETNLEAKIINDLSKKLSLQTQFNTINTIESGGMSIIESQKFKSLIEEFRGEALYVVLWSEAGYLNFLNIKPYPYLKRKIRKNQARLLLININQSKNDWINNRQFFGLNDPSITHKRMDFGLDSETSKIYFNNIFPYYLGIDKKGNVLDGFPPLPSSYEIKDYMKPLIKYKLKPKD